MLSSPYLPFLLFFMETTFSVIFNLQAFRKNFSWFYGSKCCSIVLSSAPVLPQAIQAFCGDLGDFKIKRNGDNKNLYESL